ncbi:unnamed protein product [Prunus armeniaca]
MFSKICSRPYRLPIGESLACDYLVPPFTLGISNEYLNQSPNLESLNLELDSILNTENHLFSPPTFVPTCLSSHIRIISMKGFQGKSDEMDATKYLLKFGLVMNKMIVSTATVAGVVIPSFPK